MKIKKEAGRPILARARKPAEAAAVTPVQRILRPVLVRWRVIALVAGAVLVVGGAFGGYLWYRDNKEDKATRAYARMQGKAAERAAVAAKKAGKNGAVDQKELDAATVRDLDEFVKRYGATGAGRASAYQLGSLLFDQGKYNDARKRFAYVKARSKGPEALLAAKGIADCDRAVGNYKAAITGYRTIYESGKDGFPGVPVGMALAACYNHEGQTGEAEKIYRRILDYDALSPYAPEAAQELAKLEQIRKGKP